MLVISQIIYRNQLFTVYGLLKKLERSFGEKGRKNNQRFIPRGKSC